MSSQYLDLPSQTVIEVEDSTHNCPKQRINTLWSKQENLIYIEFLKEHKDFFTTEEVRRHNKVFIQLAKLMPSRTSDQCRSHHQKMMISHKSIDKVIKHLNKKINKAQKKKRISNYNTEVESPNELEVLSYEKKAMAQESDRLHEITESFTFCFNQDSLWDVLA